MDSIKILSVLAIAVLVLSSFLIGYAVKAPEKEIQFIEKEVVSQVLDEETAAKINFLYGEATKEDRIEAKMTAKVLEESRAEISSRDFKKAVFEALVDFGETVEEYQDITEIKILDENVEGDEVVVKIKVFYFIDGDEVEKKEARFEDLTFKLVDYEVDEDDEEDIDFSDAEIEILDDVEVRRVYD